MKTSPWIFGISAIAQYEGLLIIDRGTRFTLSRDELLTFPEFVLLTLFPNGFLPDGHLNSYEGDVYPVDVSSPSIITQIPSRSCPVLSTCTSSTSGGFVSSSFGTSRD